MTVCRPCSNALSWRRKNVFHFKCHGRLKWKKYIHDFPVWLKALTHFCLAMLYNITTLMKKWWFDQYYMQWKIIYWNGSQIFCPQCKPKFWILVYFCQHIVGVTIIQIPHIGLVNLAVLELCSGATVVTGHFCNWSGGHVVYSAAHMRGPKGEQTPTVISGSSGKTRWVR